MLPLAPLTALPLAASAYNAAASALGLGGGTAADRTALARGPAAGIAAGGRSFGDVLQSAVEGAVQQGRAADAVSSRALVGQAGATEVVLAVAKAEVALQTAVAVRDRVIAAYQEVMRMPI